MERYRLGIIFGFFAIIISICLAILALSFQERLSKPDEKDLAQYKKDETILIEAKSRYSEQVKWVMDNMAWYDVKNKDRNGPGRKPTFAEASAHVDKEIEKLSPKQKLGTYYETITGISFLLFFVGFPFLVYGLYGWKSATDDDTSNLKDGCEITSKFRSLIHFIFDKKSIFEFLPAFHKKVILLFILIIGILIFMLIDCMTTFISGLVYGMVIRFMVYFGLPVCVIFELFVKKRDL